MKEWFNKPATLLRMVLRSRKTKTSRHRRFPHAPEWHNKWDDSIWLEQYLSQGRKDFYQEVIALLPQHPARLLDAGCGPGYFLHLLTDSTVSRKSTEFIGMDVSQAAVKVATRRCPEASIIHGSLYHIPLAPDSTDLIVCTEVLEHLLKPRQALDELMRALQPGGHAFISVPDGEIDQWEGHNNFWSEGAFKEFLKPYQFIFERIENGRILAATLSK